MLMESDARARACSIVWRNVTQPLFFETADILWRCVVRAPQSHDVVAPQQQRVSGVACNPPIEAKSADGRSVTVESVLPYPAVDMRP